jgi:hypothetical protein
MKKDKKLDGGQSLLTVTDKRQTRQQNSDRINIWSQDPQWAQHQDVLTD